MTSAHGARGALAVYQVPLEFWPAAPAALYGFEFGALLVGQKIGKDVHERSILPGP